jgi:hypothetical protein
VTRVVVISMLTCLVGIQAGSRNAEKSQAGSTLIRQIDHVLIDVRNKETLTAFLTDTIGLPLVWGGPGSTWTGSVGISAGNVIVELFTDDSIGINGIAFEAVDFAGLHDEVERRQIPHREPTKWPPDTAGRRWSTFPLQNLGFTVFVVQYHQINMAERRQKFALTLSERGGGALGITRVLEIQRAVAAFTDAQGYWNRLATPSATAFWRFGDGPAVRLVDSAGQRWSVMVVEVAGRAKAATALRTLNVRYTESGDTLQPDPDRFGGMQLKLVPSR